MEAIFLKILNMSITASWLVLAIVILRLILKKAPKAISVFMWAVVGVRLICPFSFESILSLIPSAETVPQDSIYSEAPAIHSGVPIFNSTVNPIISESLAPEVGASVNPMQIIAFVASVVWIVGIVAMLLYTVISYFRIHRKVREAVPYQDNIWLCDHIDTPFILGVIRPRIYLPSNMNEQDIEYVIAHEKAHLKRHDHWWKPLGFLLLTVYWFNPILWIAYILLCKDIELACDEKVIKDMGTEIKKPYSEALINCSVPRKMISACPLAFGEVGVKGRVKSVLNYKKPAFWIIVVAVIACIALSVGFLTNPATKLDTNMASFIEEQIIEYHHGGYKSGEFYCTDFKVLGTNKDKENTTVYMWVLYSEYDKVNGKIEDVSGAHIPTVITVKKTDSSQYELVEYWEPRDGSYYAEDIKEKFPWYLHGKALDSQRYIKEQQENCNRKAQAYFASANSINTEFEGVYISLESYNTDEGGQTHFNVVWHNETNSEITFGESFSIEQKTGTEWKDAEFDEDEVFHLIGILLKPQSTENKTYITEHYDLSKAGTYRLVLPFSVKDGDNYKQYKTWAEFNVGEVLSSQSLKEKYPQFFNVSTDGGLKVYIWQMSKNNYQCYLVNRGIDMLADQSFAFEVGATIAEMRGILTTYDVDQKDIVIHPVKNPLSSYYYEIDDTYKTNIEKLFWSTVPYVDSYQYSPIIDTATFDIDGDGKDEQCTLSAGPTSGLFTFIFSVSENGNLECFNIFNSAAMNLHFEKNAEGVMMLVGKVGDKTRYMGMDVSDGNIVISSDEQDISYWGEQGLNSPYAPKTASKLNNAIAKVLKEKYRAEKPDGLVHIESYTLLANEVASGTPKVGNTEHAEEVTVYLIVFHMKYKIHEIVEEVEGDFVPTAITFSVDENGEYSLKDYWIPRSGANYSGDIRAKFPGAAADDALNIEKYAEALTNDSWSQATAYLNSLQNNN